ncbi:MAG: hypothetical protein R3C61_09225 [Bacteroidia bacterium]
MEPKIFLKKRADSAYQLCLQLNMRRGYDFAGISHYSMNPDLSDNHICREIKISLVRIPYTVHDAPLEFALPVSIKEKAEGCALRVFVTLIDAEDHTAEAILFDKTLCLKEMIELRETKHSGTPATFQWTRVRSL